MNFVRKVSHKEHKEREDHKEELLSAYPYLEREDIMQAIRYAADIDKGALVTIDPRKTRVTLLPLRVL